MRGNRAARWLARWAALLRQRGGPLSLAERDAALGLVVLGRFHDLDDHRLGIDATRQQPQCGFSHKVVTMLNTSKADFEVVNVLDERYRDEPGRTLADMQRQEEAESGACAARDPFNAEASLTPRRPGPRTSRS